jgi:hypothetical protein
MKHLALSGLLLTLSCSAHAGEYRLIENPPASAKDFIKDSFTVQYSADDFTDKIDEAQILFIPADFSQQAAFFMRCRPYLTNFSVQYLEQQERLQESDGSLANASASYAKHGYIYNAKHDLTLRAASRKAHIEADVGGQNNHLTKLFKTDIDPVPGLLGMSFHYTFNYTDMPDFRSASNNADTRDAYAILTHAIQTQSPLMVELDGRRGPDRTFTLDTARMLKAVPEEVIEFCLTGRKLIQ